MKAEAAPDEVSTDDLRFWYHVVKENRPSTLHSEEEEREGGKEEEEEEGEEEEEEEESCRQLAAASANMATEAGVVAGQGE